MSGGFEDLIGGLLGGSSDGSSGGGLGGMISGLLGGGGGGGGGGAAGMAGIVGALAPMATKFLKDGGLDKLMSNFKDAGLADKADSWVGTGPNAELSAAEAAQVMPNATKELAAQAGISEDEAADVLSKVVPGLVDKVTPNGEVPSQEEISGALTKLGIA